MSTARSAVFLGAVLSLFTACTGAISESSTDDRSSLPGPDGDPGAPSGGPTATGAAGSPVAASCSPRPGPAPIRRLSRFEYDNTIRDLLGDESRPGQVLPADEANGGFSNQAEILSTSALLTQGYLDAAEGIAARAMKSQLPALVPCDPRTGDAACARRFVEAFGRRAWRRPLVATEVDALARIHAGAAADAGFAAGIQATLEAMLQAPQFLYRPETGTPGPDGTSRLTSWEVASRLSYLLWASTPDDALLAAAESDQLTTKAQIAAQGRRLLADKRARPVVQRFAEEWLGISQVATLGKDTKAVPRWKSTQGALFREETRRFFEDLVFSDRRPSALTLFTGRETFMNDELARLYGVTGPTSAAFERVALPPGQRAGLLTQMSILGTYAFADQTSPIHRGKVVRLQVLCGQLPSAPNDVPIKVPELSPKLTTRERFTQHATDPFCHACHRLMDGIGLTFENYDALGVWRDQENGKPIDASGELVATDVDGPVANALELGERIAGSKQARACLVRQWFRFSFGRQEVEADACTVAQLHASFEDKGFDLAAMILETVQTESFTSRQLGGTR